MVGFLKKIFSFGFGRKKKAEAEKEEEKTVEQTVEIEPEPEPDPVAAKPKAVTNAVKVAKKVEKPAKKKIAAKKPVVEKTDGERVTSKVEPVIEPAPAPKPKPAPELIKVPLAPKPPSGTMPSGTVSIGQEKTPEPVQQEEEPPTKEGWFKRLRKGLARTSTQLTENVTAIFTKRKLDDDTLQELEDVLIQADLGVDTAMRITQALSDQRYGKDVSDEEVRDIMAAEIEKTLEPVALPLELDLEKKPHVILVVGVNGSGKTTTIGKLTAKLKLAGLSTLLVAGDTFRAAAIEQLKIWGDRTDAPVVSRELGSDAAGLAYDAFEQAKSGGYDVMMMDTAGRLQNKTELMDELEKIIRVMKKHDESAPHTVLLTLDATTGQNALNQVEIFEQVAGVNGLVMTKLDGTARGGILVAISARHKLPVYFVGVGEQVDDLEPFEAREFARSIAGLDA